MVMFSTSSHQWETCNVWEDMKKEEEGCNVNAGTHIHCSTLSNLPELLFS